MQLDMFGVHHVCSLRPLNPRAGDTHLHTGDGYLYTYNGTNWLKAKPMMQPSPLQLLIDQLGAERVGAMVEEMRDLEALAQENETVRVLLSQLRVAAKLIRE